MLQFHEFSKFNKCILQKKKSTTVHCVWHDLEHQRMKKNRINDESMENWSALHINGRKVHYREQSLVVATAKIIIMSALGPNPCLAPSSASISKIQNTFGVRSLFYQSKLKKTQKAGPFKRIEKKVSFGILYEKIDKKLNSKNNNHERIGAQPLPGAIKCIDLKNAIHFWSYKFVCLFEWTLSEKDEWASLLEFSFLSLAFLGNCKNNNQERIGAQPLPGAIKCINHNQKLLELQAQY